jgi:hypothetical protein
MKHEDKKMDKKMMSEMISKHAGKPASKAHKGLRAGGKTNIDMLKMGRGLAKVANQKSPGRKGA